MPLDHPVMVRLTAERDRLRDELRSVSLARSREILGRLEVIEKRIRALRGEEE